jgi:DNA-binding HxlR family transcriptional regulator
LYPAFRSNCPIASALDLFGDKWTLVVLRTIFAGRHRFGELGGMAEPIATNMLADRLQRLEDFGLIERRVYSERPPRHEYWLTPRGADALPILQAMAAWSQQHIPDRWASPGWFAEGVPQDFYPKP